MDISFLDYVLVGKKKKKKKSADTWQHMCERWVTKSIDYFICSLVLDLFDTSK